MKFIVRIGDIFEAVGNAALENNVQLIIMGTHGLKGFQFLTGSNALRVVANSEVPFIIVQKDTKVVDGYKNILVPMNLDEDSKQKLAYARNMALFFGSKIHLIAQDEDDEYLHNKIIRDINYSEKYFTDAGVEYEVDVMKPSKNLDPYLDYAVKKNIDLVVILNQSNSVFNLFGDEIQKAITNKNCLPVMLINPVNTRIVSVFANYSP